MSLGLRSVLRTWRRRAAARPVARGGGQRGFSIIELMIALTVLLIGMAGIMTMHVTASRSSAWSRHATEAAVLAEDRLEVLRTAPANTLVSGSENVDAQGIQDAAGFYTREWLIAAEGATWLITVRVTWREGGDAEQEHIFTVRTRRSQ